MLKVFVPLILVLVCGAAIADDAAVPPLYRLVAEENRVPAKLFFAMILNESRSRTRNDGSKVLPWPWTINHRGKPYYFQTKEQAVRFTESLVESGDKNFGVGLGQIHWSYHYKEFESLRAAFDPYKNLTYAAKYLRRQYDSKECGSWAQAIGCYHRPGQRPQDIKVANIYRQKVIKIWQNI